MTPIKSCNATMAAATFVVYAGLLTGCDDYVEKAKYEAIREQLAEAQKQLVDSQAKLISCQQEPKRKSPQPQLSACFAQADDRSTRYIKDNAERDVNGQLIVEHGTVRVSQFAVEEARRQK